MGSDSAIRIAAFAGFYGDRPDAFDEAISTAPDVLIGDYLAELTMLVLQKVRARGGPGYAAGFLKDLSGHLGTIADRGMKVVTNAGGLDPLGCAEAVRALCAKLGVELRVAAVTGDDLIGRIEHFRSDERQAFDHLETGAPLSVDISEVLTANAYLGAWPIAAALHAGADIVICPRVTDASLTIGPAAWRHGWGCEEWDKLAGALLAGHLIECSTQVSGGNYAFFEEVDRSRIPGMPYVDIDPDGTFSVGKAPDTGGAVTIDTVKAQLLYEVGGRYYHNPDVILDLQSVELEQRIDGVRLSRMRGLPPTSRLKVSLCYDAGWRNTMTLGLTGLKIVEKAEWVEKIFDDRVAPRGSFDDVDISVIGPAASGGGSYQSNTALMIISVADKDQSKVSRERFSNRILSSVFAALPGCYFTSPPQKERQIAVQWPCLFDKHLVTPFLHIDGQSRAIAWSPTADAPLDAGDGMPTIPAASFPALDGNNSIPLGALFGTRSGDKGGTANLRVWARDERSWSWLHDWLTVDRLRELLPETRDLAIARHVFPNLLAMNFMIYRFLGDGVAACLRPDAQAKALGEYLAARPIPVPSSLRARDAEHGTGADHKLEHAA